MNPALERRFHMRDKLKRMKREIADEEFKEKMEEERRNKPKPSARNQKSLRESKRGRTRYKRVKVRYIVHNDDGTRTVCRTPKRKPWIHRHRISIGYWATH